MYSMCRRCDYRQPDLIEKRRKQDYNEGAAGCCCAFFGGQTLYPYIEIMNKRFPSYGLMVYVGIFITIIFLEYRCYRRNMSMDDELYFAAFLLIFSVIGAKLLYVALNFKEILSFAASTHRDWKDFLDYLGGGFVFYGGLIGAFLGALLYGAYFHQDISDLVCVSVPAIPLFQFFGRTGCFLAGCCYGCPSDSFLAVAFTHAIAAPNFVPLLPVQLFEAFFNLILFFILLRFEKSFHDASKVLGLYLVLYGAMRFILEFFRGDTVRGMWLFLSTSQWISLVLIPAGVYLLAEKEEKNYFARLIRGFS